MDIKLESEDANFAFPEVASGTSPNNKSLTTRSTANGINLGNVSGSRTGNGNSVSRIVGVTRPRPALGVLTKRTSTAHQGPVTLTSQLCMSSNRCVKYILVFNLSSYMIEIDKISIQNSSF